MTHARTSNLIPVGAWQSSTSPLPLAAGPAWVNAYPANVAAGFPSPAEDHLVQRIDLMAQLIRHPQATFMLRVRGESMRDAGTFDGDVGVAKPSFQVGAS